IIKASLPDTVVDKLKYYNVILASLVLIGALVSFYLPGLAIGAVGLAIIGKLYINGLIEKEDLQKEPTFIALNNDLKIFAIVPDSPAAILGLKVGDTITKVNQMDVHSPTELEEQLSSMIQFPNFEVISTNHQVKNIHNTSYKGNLTELGIIFPIIRDNK